MSNYKNIQEGKNLAYSPEQLALSDDSDLNRNSYTFFFWFKLAENAHPATAVLKFLNTQNMLDIVLFGIRIILPLIKTWITRSPKGFDSVSEFNFPLWFVISVYMIDVEIIHMVLQVVGLILSIPARSELKKAQILKTGKINKTKCTLVYYIVLLVITSLIFTTWILISVLFYLDPNA